MSLEEWRAASWTATSGTPRSSSIVTKVWRSLCGLIPSTCPSSSPTSPGVLGQLAEQPVDGLAVVRDARGGRAAAQPPAVLAAEDRALGAGADRLQDRALGALVERDLDLLAALAAHDERVAAAGLAPQVLDVDGADLRHAQAVEHEQAHHRLGLGPRSVATASSRRTCSSVIARPRGSRRSRGPLTPAAGEPGITRRSLR